MLSLVAGDGAAVNVLPLSPRRAISTFSSGLPVADLFHPVDDFAVEPLLNGDVRIAIVGVPPCPRLRPGRNQ